MDTGGARGVHAVRDGEDFLAHLAGQAGGDEGAASLAGLHDDGAQRQGRQDTVPPREVLGARGGFHRELAHEGPLSGDGVGQAAILRRIDPGEAVAEDGQGPPACRQGARVGGRVDSPRKTGDHRKAHPRQASRQALGLVLAV